MTIEPKAVSLEFSRPLAGGVSALQESTGIQKIMTIVLNKFQAFSRWNRNIVKHWQFYWRTYKHIQPCLHHSIGRPDKQIPLFCQLNL